MRTRVYVMRVRLSRGETKEYLAVRQLILGTLRYGNSQRVPCGTVIMGEFDIGEKGDTIASEIGHRNRAGMNPVRVKGEFQGRVLQKQT